VPASQYEKGVIATASSAHQRPLAVRATTVDKAAESLYLDKEGNICCGGSSSGFFALLDGVLITPTPHQPIVDVTQAVLMRLARNVIPCKTGSIAYREIPLISECFICSSSREVLPVVQIDTIVVSDGKPGPVSSKLLNLFREYAFKGYFTALKISQD